MQVAEHERVSAPRGERAASPTLFVIKWDAEPLERPLPPPLTVLMRWMWMAAVASESVGLSRDDIQVVRDALQREARGASCSMPYNAPFMTPAERAAFSAPTVRHRGFDTLLAAQYSYPAELPPGAVVGYVGDYRFDGYALSTDVGVTTGGSVNDAIAVCVSRVGTWLCARRGVLVVPGHWTPAMLPAVPAITAAGKHKPATAAFMRRVEAVMVRELETRGKRSEENDQ